MARPSQYSQGRRIAMQATLAGVLLCTLGLAALVGQSRERAMAVEWAAKPHLTEYLSIRLPKGWEPDERGDGLPLLVSATAPLKEGASRVTEIKEARGVVVYQTEVLPPGGAEALLRQYVADTPGNLGRPRRFDVLGEAGVIVRFEAHLADEYGQFVQVPGWYAAAVLPTAGPGGGPLGVVLGAKGLGADGPAGPRLLRQLADGLGQRSH
jgi:hypothetical protein